MSPEQATASRELDGRSDLYAVGCVLYEMLAGQPPFIGATAQQLLARHAIDPVPPLRTVRGHGAGRGGAERDARAGQAAGRPLPHRRGVRRGARRHRASTTRTAASTRRWRPRRLGLLALAGVPVLGLVCAA